MKDISRIEAIERAKIIASCSYEIFLDLTENDRAGSDKFFCRTCIRFGAKENANTFLDAFASRIESVVLNGANLDVQRVFDGSRIALEGLKTNNEVVVEGYFSYTNTGEGMHKFTDPADDETYLYTQCEVSDARRIFAVFEQPDIKATFSFSVRAPGHWHVISNGRCLNVQEEVGETKQGKAKLWSFAQTPEMSSYLAAIVAGPYEGVQSQYTVKQNKATQRSAADSVPLGIYCRKSMRQYLDADYIFDITRKGFEYYESKFDYPFPFEKYDQVFLPEYNMGAMENIGCVTLSEVYIFRGRVDRAIKERRVVTILHELAHMWFGNLVTMRWWNDLWLNESFAEIASTMAAGRVTEYADSWATFALLEKTWAYAEDQLPTTHPIVARVDSLSDVYSNFDGITYAKGASVLKQLIHWVGEDNFHRGLNRYFQKYQYGNATLKDLLRELSLASNKELDKWSEQWLETSGVNAVSAEFSVQDGKFSSFSLEQSGDQRSHKLNIGLYELQEDELKRIAQVPVSIEGNKTVVNELVGVKRPDLILLNDEDYAYCKIRFDVQSLDCILNNLSRLEDSLARAVIWSNLWLNVRDCLVDPNLFVEAVVGHVEKEQDAKWILDRLYACLGLYIKDSAAAKASVAEKLWAMFTRASVGSDNHLQFLKNYAMISSTKTQHERVRALLSGQYAGADLDTDLRWHLVAALARVNCIDKDEITDFEEKDKTITGRDQAALARAALPENKADAWKKVLEDKTLPNSTIRSIATGFRLVQSREQLAPFIDVYFENILSIFETRTFAIANLIARGMFPMAAADGSLIEKTKAWLLKNNDAPAGLKRVIVENLHEAEIAVKLRECFS